MATLLRHVDRRALLFAALALGVFAIVAASPRLLRDEVGDSLRTLEDAHPGLLWVAAACFVALIGCMGLAWRAGVRAVGGQVDVVDATARYAAGSFVTALVPAGAGGALRIALFSRRLPDGDRLWRAGGISAAIAAARAMALAVIAAVAAGLGAFPIWPVALLLGVAAAAVVAAFFARNHPARSHVAHVLDVFGALAARPRLAVTLIGAVGAATALRVAAAVAIAAALDVSSPVSAGIVAVAALTLAGLIQLTPGNIGVGSGALALALHARGVNMDLALSTGIAFQAVETAVALGIGGTALIYLARLPLPSWALRGAGVSAMVLLAGAFSLTVLG
jgi:uncharacterized membrane protein YbhN (UPF0104 family)